VPEIRVLQRRIVTVPFELSIAFLVFDIAPAFVRMPSPLGDSIWLEKSKMETDFLKIDRLDEGNSL
jgi:hypothetical protein